MRIRLEYFEAITVLDNEKEMASPENETLFPVRVASQNFRSDTFQHVCIMKSSSPLERSKAEERSLVGFKYGAPFYYFLAKCDII